MLLSKIAARQVSLRALRAVPQATTVPGINPNARQFQTSQPQYNQVQERPEKHQKVKTAAYKDELRLFNDKLNNYSQMSKVRAANMLMDLEQSMGIYTKLKSVNPFYPGDIARLLQTLHTSIRISRRDANKYKSQKRNISNETQKIKSFLLTIAEDMRNGVVQASSWGVVHLFTAFATMEVPREGLDLWTKLSNYDDSKCAKIMWSPNVVGSIIDLMILVDTPFSTIETVYKTAKENGESSNIEQAMIGALIKNNMITDALELFSSMLQVYPNEQYALARTHDRFVGDCDDTSTALNFFFEGIEGKTPYKAATHPSTVYRLMERLWSTSTEPDFNKVEEVWKTYIANVPPNMGEWMFNSTVNFYLKAFMDNYPKPTAEAVSRLKDSIQFYIKARVTITPIFLNTVLSAVQPWADRDIVFTIINAFQIYHLPEDVVSCRIILNALENIEVDDTVIIDRWNKLAEAQTRGFHTFDFVALLRACDKPHREQIFAQIFEPLLRNNQIPDQTLRSLNDTIKINVRLTSKKPLFDDLLRRNFVEIKPDGTVVHVQPFSG